MLTHPMLFLSYSQKRTKFPYPLKGSNLISQMKLEQFTQIFFLGLETVFSPFKVSDFEVNMLCYFWCKQA